MSIEIPSRGLRAAKKERTRQALGQAAIAIVAAGGIDALTADRIAAEAGVSRRTLFNYFPHVEDVLTATIDEVMRESLAVFVSRPPEEPLRRSIAAVLAGLVDHPIFEHAIELERAAHASQATRRFLREYDDRIIDMIETGVHERIGEQADATYVAALAASVGAIMTRMTRLVVELTADADLAPAEVTPRLHEAIATAFDFLFAGFDEAGALTDSSDKDN